MTIAKHIRYFMRLQVEGSRRGKVGKAAQGENPGCQLHLCSAECQLQTDNAGSLRLAKKLIEQPLQFMDPF